MMNAGDKFLKELVDNIEKLTATMEPVPEVDPDNLSQLIDVVQRAIGTIGTVIVKTAKENPLLRDSYDLEGELARLEGGLAGSLPPLFDGQIRRSIQRWVSDAPGDVHNNAARTALDREKAPAEALPLLARELWAICPQLVATVAPIFDPPMTDHKVLPVRDGMLALDADLADWLATLDQGDADKVRTAGVERLARYHAGELGIFGLLEKWDGAGADRLANVAVTLWRVRVADLWKRKQTVPPALVRAVAVDTLLPAMTKRVYLPGLDDGRILDDRKRELGRISTVSAEILEETRRGLDLLGSVTGHRLVRFIVHAVHDQVEAGDPFALRIELPGGWSALAEKLRHTSRDYEPLQLLMQAGQHAEWTHPNAIIGGLWTYTYRRGNATAPGRLTITAGEALAPGLAAQLSDAGNTSHAARIARRLVPELRAEPPVSAVENRSQGAAWTLHRLALVELVDNAEELYRGGAVLIASQRWRELAKEARLPSETLPRLLQSWTAGDDNAPPLLVEPEPGRWTLADAHKAERDFIANSGKRRSVGRQNARKGKAGKNLE